VEKSSWNAYRGGLRAGSIISITRHHQVAIEEHRVPAVKLNEKVLNKTMVGGVPAAQGKPPKRGKGGAKGSRASPWHSKIMIGDLRSSSAEPNQPRHLDVN